MGAPIAAFLTLVLSLLLLRRLVFRPVVPGMDANLLDGAAIAALNRDRRQELEQRRSTTRAMELLPLPGTPQEARDHLKWLEQLRRWDALSEWCVWCAPRSHKAYCDKELGESNQNKAEKTATIDKLSTPVSYTHLRAHET